jgi:hypothetical protein
VHRVEQGRVRRCHVSLRNEAARRTNHKHKDGGPRRNLNLASLT